MVYIYLSLLTPYSVDIITVTSIKYVYTKIDAFHHVLVNRVPYLQSWVRSKYCHTSNKRIKGRYNKIITKQGRQCD